MRDRNGAVQMRDRNGAAQMRDRNGAAQIRERPGAALKSTAITITTTPPSLLPLPYTKHTNGKTRKRGVMLERYVKI